MPSGIFHTQSRSFTVLLAALTALFVLSILLFPDRAFQSSLGGLSLWWNVVFPALLPFLIVAELMIGLGLARSVGVLLDPLMRVLFRLPGAGGLALAMGGLAGGPAGAQIAGKLRSDGAVTREQGERLLGMSHMSSPFLILSVIGAGFLHHPATGTAIAVIHYGSAFVAAIVMRFARKEESRLQLPLKSAAYTVVRMPLLVKFFREMHEARLQDGRTFGKLLGDAVSGAIQTLLAIGGVIMMFSVVMHALQLSLAAPAFNAALGLVIRLFGYNGAAAPDWIPSILEVHLGTYAFSQFNPGGAGMPWQAALIGLALGWSGLSHHLQVQSLVRHTDLRYWPFLVHRLLHGGLAFGSTLALWNPLQTMLARARPSFLSFPAAMPPAFDLPVSGKTSIATEAWSGWTAFPGRLEQFALLLLTLFVLSGAIALIRRLVSASTERLS
ncbi:sporulation protein [Paenibacillus koleovorans]|uniref:sporulation protein n=1 Tax=Paenibacillus koleovorans TaxID=121608 RepID=UPI000FDCAD21|nr:sporulation protein [Paenibacillus koleovorans]